MRKPAREGAHLDLLLVNRGLVGDVVVRGYPGHRDHKRTSFCSQSCKEGSQQNCCLGLPEALASLQDVPWDVVPRGEGSAGRLNTAQENNLKGAGAGMVSSQVFMC